MYWRMYRSTGGATQGWAPLQKGCIVNRSWMLQDDMVWYGRDTGGEREDGWDGAGFGVVKGCGWKGAS